MGGGGSGGGGGGGGGFCRETFQRGQGSFIHFPLLHPCPLQYVIAVYMSMSLPGSLRPRKGSYSRED